MKFCASPHTRPCQELSTGDNTSYQPATIVWPNHICLGLTPSILNPCLNTHTHTYLCLYHLKMQVTCQNISHMPGCITATPHSKLAVQSHPDRALPNHTTLKDCLYNTWGGLISATQTPSIPLPFDSGIPRDWHVLAATRLTQTIESCHRCPASWSRAASSKLSPEEPCPPIQGSPVACCPTAPQ